MFNAIAICCKMQKSMPKYRCYFYSFWNNILNSKLHTEMIFSQGMFKSLRTRSEKILEALALRDAGLKFK